MKCYCCNDDIDDNDYCVCTKCRKRICPHCADKNAFVCPDCRGSVAYLS